jgi:hypothetical protein
MTEEAQSEIRTLLVVAKTYIATSQPSKAVKAIDEALALVAPPQAVIITNATGAA